MKKYITAHPLLLGFYAIVAIAWATISVLFAFVMGAFVNLVVDGTMEQLYKTIFWSLLWLVADILLDWGYKYLKNMLLKNISLELRRDLFQSILSKNSSDFNATNSGTYMADLTTNINMLEAQYFDTLLSSIGSYTNILVSFVAMLYIDISTVYIAAIFIVICTVIPNLAKSLIEKRSRQLLGGVEEYTVHAKEYLGGYSVIKTFLALPQFERKHNEYSRSLEEKRFAQANLHKILQCITAFTGILATIVALGYGAYLTIHGYTTGGAITALGHLIGRVSSVFMAITSLISNLTASKPIIKRFQDILSQQPTAETEIANRESIETIHCQQVSFSYGDKPALHAISLCFEKGKRYAILGDSGCGKTTLFKLLLKYYDNYSGEITLNGKNLHNIPTQQLYRSVGTVSQEVYLFEDSIRNNLTLLKDFSDAEITAAITKAGLGNMLASLPQGVNTILSENGSNLSGGERQRIALARMLLHDRTVLLLDEFTANLDMQISESIEEELQKLDDKIVIHITHKVIPEILQKYDCVIVMKQGEICQLGSFDSLKQTEFYTSSKVSLV